eukprot:TRINITY_DN17002_c0_g1_i1.p2 TRINITY_DN17002_c0_g1~~TRINITY_DN17002_c0_g1_i1.p2  ORF type:complete len:134 (-),score=19.65 TRINITY_DN17002_c0_g1_i1:113-514(-)
MLSHKIFCMFGAIKPRIPKMAVLRQFSVYSQGDTSDPSFEKPQVEPSQKMRGPPEARMSNVSKTRTTRASNEEGFRGDDVILRGDEDWETILEPTREGEHPKPLHRPDMSKSENEQDELAHPKNQASGQCQIL